MKKFWTWTGYMILLLGMATTVIAQTPARTDTVQVKGGSFFILGDSTVFVKRDTVFILPDSVAAQVKGNRDSKNILFFQRLRDRMYKKRVTKEIYDLLFTDPTGSAKSVVNVQSKSEALNYDNFQGRRIGKIEIKKLGVFGTSLRDTSRQIDKWAIRTANNLHMYTRDKVILKNLLFEEGDVVDTDEITDSERLLRTQPFIKDARIYLSELESGEVEAVIVVRDTWTLTPDISFDDFTDFGLGFRERNFLGYGHELRGNFNYVEAFDPAVGLEAAYVIRNIKNSFIDVGIDIADSYPLDRKRLQITRDFVTPDTKYAGGLTIARERVLNTRIYSDTTIQFFTEYQFNDLWFGRSIPLPQMSNNDGRRAFQLASSISRRNYFDRPEFRVDTNRVFQDYTLWLTSFGLSSRNYQKSSLINGFGRTEDIPMGFLIQLTAGKEWNNFNDRTYWGLQLSGAKYVAKLGYFSPAFELSGFRNGNQWEQGILRWQMLYSSYLYRLNRYNFRQFFRINYTVGINRFDNEFVNINESNGIRGLSNPFFRGTRKLSFSSETVAFTPFFLMGFRFAFYLFTDFALVNDQQFSLFKNKLYQGYGLGIRLRNDNLTFNTFELRLGWYPNVPVGVSNWDFEISGRSAINLQDFQIREPRVIPFE